MAVANQKGGVGKTTTAVNLGACLADLGYRALVIDLDPQGNASTGLGINIRALEASMYDVHPPRRPARGLHRGQRRCGTCSWRPASLDLAGAEIELVPAFSRELRAASNALSEVLDDYDYVLIDCPPSLGLLTVNGMAAATEVLVPIQCEYYALEGLGQLLRNVDLVQKNLNPTLEVSTIVLVMYDARTKLADQVVQEVREPLRRQGVSQRRAPHGAALRGAVVRAADHRVRLRAPAARSPTGSWPRRSVVARRSGLGKGLGALIPTRGPAGSQASRAAGDPGAARSTRTRTSRGRTSTRRRWSSLTASIRELGVLQPVLVRPVGRRAVRADRRRAAVAGGQAGRAASPSRRSSATVDDVASLEQALVENLHREDLNPLEEAAAYQQLIEDFGLTHERGGPPGRQEPLGGRQHPAAVPAAAAIQQLRGRGPAHRRPRPGPAGHARPGVPGGAGPPGRRRGPVGARGRGGGPGTHEEDGRAPTRVPAGLPRPRRSAAAAGLLELEELLSSTHWRPG